MPFFCRSRDPVVTVDQFLSFVGSFLSQEAQLHLPPVSGRDLQEVARSHLLPREPLLDLPRITGREQQEVARAKKSTAGGLDGWAWNEIKDLPLPWFSGFAILLNMVESTGIWPQGLLDAYIAMIPKADGDSTPLGQRPLSVLRRIGFLGGFLGLSFVLGMAFLLHRLGSLLPWILRRFFLGLVGSASYYGC